MTTIYTKFNISVNAVKVLFIDKKNCKSIMRTTEKILFKFVEREGMG